MVCFRHHLLRGQASSDSFIDIHAVCQQFEKWMRVRGLRTRTLRCQDDSEKQGGARRDCLIASFFGFTTIIIAVRRAPFHSFVRCLVLGELISCLRDFDLVSFLAIAKNVPFMAF
jgi:hypothetical protein